MSAGPNRPCPYLGELSVTEGCSKVSIDVAWIAMCRCKCEQVALGIRVKLCAMYVGQVLSDTNSQSITSTVPSDFGVDILSGDTMFVSNLKHTYSRSNYLYM